MSAPRILGVIPARGGSKGLPGKNLALLRGRPLICHCLTAAADSSLLTRTIVSSDDPEIIRIARQNGADVPFTRPAELATDEASSAGVAQHALRALQQQAGEEFDYLCLLQPTTPLRTAADIDQALRLLLESKAEAVVSVCRVREPHPVRTLRVVDGKLTPFLPHLWQHHLRRQDLPAVFAPNGAIYGVCVEVLREKGSLWGSITLPYEMPAERSVNIDSARDLAFAEFLLAGNRE